MLKQGSGLFLSCIAAVGLSGARLDAQGPSPLDAAKSTPAPQLIGRIGFGSCCNQKKPQDVWNTIVDQKPDLFLMLGDNVYADTENMDVLRAAYARLGSVEGFRRLRATCPVLATWDDHDYGANDAGAEFPKKRESQRVFLEFFDGPSSPRWSRDGVYDAKVFGPPGRRVQIILLDTRFFRSPLVRREAITLEGITRIGPYVANNDANSTILGEAQWNWLEEQLRVEAEIRIIASSIQVITEGNGIENWANFPHERQRLFNLIRVTRAAGVVLVSGDLHAAEISKVDAGVGYTLFDITSSSLNRPRAFLVVPNRHRIGWLPQYLGGSIFFGANFGMIQIDWTRPDPLIRLEIHDDQGQTVIHQNVLLSELQSIANNG